MNLLTEANTKVADQLFATLDSTLRKVVLPTGRQVIISDTVGFIKKLPHQLIASFNATLEEVKKADILLHVVDSSHPKMEEQIKVVNQVLSDLGVLNKMTLLVFNKADLIDDDKLFELEIRYPESVTISALTGEGRDDLIAKISDILLAEMTTVNLKIPYNEAHWVDKLHRQGEVYQEKYSNNEILISARITEKLAGRLKEYICN
ncbi:MAG: GTPase [Halanaerobiales bacterium]|nr:GTPase [Halanaerobiales bacterium]